MSEIKNTKAKYFLKKFDFSQEGAELSYTVAALGGSATQKGDESAYLYKANNKELTEEEKEILEEIKKAETVENVDITDLESSLEVALRAKVFGMMPTYRYMSVWVEKLSSKEVIYTVDYDNTYKVSYTVDGDNVVIGDDVIEVERKLIYQEKDNIVKSNLDANSFALSKSEDPLDWKFRKDTKEHLESSVEILEKGSIELTEEDTVLVKEELAKAFKEICLEEELPKVLKASDTDTSDAASGGNTNESMPSGINENINKKGNMSDDKDKVVEKDQDFIDLKKSVEEMADLLKAANLRAEKAEQEAEDIAKAAEAERVEKAKNDLTDVVKAWEAVENTEEVVEALFKAENVEVLLKAMEDLNTKVEEVKKKFGEEEHGVDGDIDVGDASDSTVLVNKALDSLKAKNKKKK